MNKLTYNLIGFYLFTEVQQKVIYLFKSKFSLVNPSTEKVIKKFSGILIINIYKAEKNIFNWGFNVFTLAKNYFTQMFNSFNL